jgi:hypothetical protein
MVKAIIITAKVTALKIAPHTEKINLSTSPSVIVEAPYRQANSKRQNTSATNRRRRSINRLRRPQLADDPQVFY